MEFFQEKGRCNEDEEVDMIGDMDKILYSSSSSSPCSQYNRGTPTTSSSSTPQFNGGWSGAQIYDNTYHTIWSSPEQAEATARSNYEQQKNMHIDHQLNNKRGESSDGGGGGGGGDDVVFIEREHMFDKVVTPSDVGKLNRLVIPKQHAEKYFPLDSTANEKGLLLNFEDRCGKSWRFRYSYWNSSQSYVMTKGWSRFVKEKKLYAGDIVSFQRGADESVKDRLYIDWRRRSDVQDHPVMLPPLPLLHPLSMPRSAPWGGLMLPPNMPMHMPRDDMVWHRMNYAHQNHNHFQRTNYNGSISANGSYNVMNSGSNPVFYLRSSAPSQQIGVVQQGGDVPMVFNSVPVVHGKASAKRLRLFGVNLECPMPAENPEYQFLDSAHPSIVSHPQIPPSIPPLQLRLYNSESPPRDEEPDSPKENMSMSLDLDM